jgi:competence protein ComEC
MRRQTFYIVIFCILLLAIRYVWFRHDHGDLFLETQVNQKIDSQGIIVAEPNVKDTSSQIIVALDLVNDRPIRKTKIIIQTDPYIHFNYGDRIFIQGKLQLPQNFSSDGGRVFDYVSYLAKDKIFYTMRYADIFLMDTHQGNKIVSAVLFIKQKFMQSLDNALPFPESRLAAGLVVAGKYALPKSIQDEFVKTGTVQVVVLSGYNVTLVAESIMGALSFLTPGLQLIFGATSIILFAVAAGGGASVLRATVMVLIALFGKSVNRKYNVGRALLVSAFIMLLFNPMLLFFDPSFQLSFLATLGLIYASPIFELYFARYIKYKKFRQVFVSTIATQVFVTPFLLYLTGTVSLVAIPANLILFLLTPLSMSLSFLTGISGLLSPILAWPFGFIGFLFLKTMLSVVHFFSILPFASTTLPGFPAWLVFSCYAIFGWVLWKFYATSRP